MPLAPTLDADPDVVREESRVLRRAERHDARRWLWRKSSLKRVRACGHHASSDQGVQLRVTGSVATGDRRAGFAGLQSCGSVWSCPVCAERITAERGDQLRRGVSTWLDGYGGSVALATFTMRHNKRQSLSKLWDGLSYGWSKVTSGRAWVDDQERYGVYLGDDRARLLWARSVETTRGEVNGWHVHIHVLLFLPGGTSRAEVQALAESMFERWSAALVRRGFATPLRDSGGLDARLLEGDADAIVKASGYISKSQYKPADPRTALAFEVAHATGKTAARGNRTPFQLLADLADGSSTDPARDRKLWREWERASKGRRQLTWARCARDVLELGQDLTDEEIVEEDLGGATLAWFDGFAWAQVRYRAPVLQSLAELDDTGDQAYAWLIAAGVPLGDRSFPDRSRTVTDPWGTAHAPTPAQAAFWKLRSD